MTWHQSKNPQDGSCRTDCLHTLPRSKPVVILRDSRATAWLTSCHRGPLLRSAPPVWCTLSLSLLPCLQGLSAAPRVRPSPLLATSYSQWALRSTIGSGKTSTSPWQSSRPLHGEPRRGLHSTYPPLKRDALCRGIVSRLLRCPIVGPHSPVRPAVLCSHPRPRESWDPRSPARSARRPNVALRSRAMLFVSSHHGHTRGTLCFSYAPRQMGAAATVRTLPVTSTPRFVAPSWRLAATGHPLFSRHSQPCQTAQRRPRTPPLLPLTPVEEAPFVGDRSPCF